MNQETVQVLYQEGAFLIFLDVPEGTVFGIDLKSWNTGEKFRGVKMIPPGLHYIFFSSVGSFGEESPRTGFFYYFKQSEILVKRWDPELENVSKHAVSEAEINTLSLNLQELDRYLGPYPYDILEKWKTMTNNISIELLVKFSPECGLIRSALDLIPIEKTEKTINLKRSPKCGYISRDENLLPDLKPVSGTGIRLSTFPNKYYPEGSSAAEITKHCLDHSYVLENIMEQHEKSLDLLGELQFCYVCFLVGHSFEAFEHWKKLVSLVCSCQSAIGKYRLLYDEFLTILEHEIFEIPEEFLADIVANKNFVYIKLRQLFRSLAEMDDLDGCLKTKAERLRRDLSDTHGWDFGRLLAEEGEDAPVIVHM